MSKFYARFVADKVEFLALLALIPFCIWGGLSYSNFLSHKQNFACELEDIKAEKDFFIQQMNEKQNKELRLLEAAVEIVGKKYPNIKIEIWQP